MVPAVPNNLDLPAVEPAGRLQVGCDSNLLLQSAETSEGYPYADVRRLVPLTAATEPEALAGAKR